jgi:hypothetical protein
MENPRKSVLEGSCTQAAIRVTHIAVFGGFFGSDGVPGRMGRLPGGRVRHRCPPLPREGGYGADDPGETERQAPGSLSHRYRRLRDFGGQVPTHRHHFQRRVGGSDCPVPVLGTRRKPAAQHDDLCMAGRVRADQEQRAQAGDSRRGAYQSGEGPQHPVNIEIIKCLA